MQAVEHWHCYQRFYGKLEIFDRVASQIQFDYLRKRRKIIRQLSYFVVTEINLRGRLENGVDVPF